MLETKSLIKDSVIYGGTTIVSKMITWLMVPLFTYTLLPDDFGMMNYLYAYMALFLVVLTFGMETGFFRFVNQTDKYKVDAVYSTTLLSIGGIVALFFVVFLGFLPFVRNFFWDDDAPSNYIRLIILILGMDAISAIPFAYLRYKKRPIKFGFLKVLNVVLYSVFCVFFLLICPWIDRHYPSLIAWFWNGDFRLGYIFISNLLATGIQTACLFAELTGFKYSFDWALAKKIFRYCFPLMLMGLAGMSNQVVDKLVFPEVYPDHAHWKSELGIYSACFKIALIMMMFTQAFRYAYEPFVFEKSKDKNAKQSYSDVMKYFVIFGLLVFLSVMFYLDIIKYFINSNYWAGLSVVPIVLIGELFFAVYFNLSIWYKLSDKTYWGTIFSVTGCIVIITLNIIFIPLYSYKACAWAAFTGNGLIMLFSYFVGQKHYPIKYDLKTIFLYSGLALLLYCIAIFIPIENLYIRLGFRTILIGIYLLVLIRRDLSLKDIPYLNRYLKQN
ncbi:polysaccharide biosynthesis protein [Bacteroidia bacterium]|nr:polysaccharide biosynthesis protein [Bacteroidia bacterium]GHU83716.1 polysaccharide biosynthesis protein [Bacteroidia bacterium]